MLPVIFAVAAAGLASAAPQRTLPPPGTFPPMGTSKGFTLVANVTDLTKDFNPPIHGLSLYPFNVRPLRNVPSLDKNGAVFWWNGTATEVIAGPGAKILTGSGLPYPDGLSAPWSDSQIRAMSLDSEPGSGDRGWNVGKGPNAMPHLYPPEPDFSKGRFSACKGVGSTSSPEITISYVWADNRGDKTWADYVPEGCVAFTLLAQCATLPPLPEGAQYNYDSTLGAPCYTDVATIDWAKYSWITVW